MFGNLKPSDQLSVVGIIHPDQAAAGTYSTGYVDMATIRQLLAIIQLGDLGGSATIDAKLRQAKDSGGTDVKDITGKAVVQMLVADKAAMINLRAEELDVNNAFTHAKLDVTIGTATSEISALLIGLEARYAPLAQHAAVVQVID